MKYIIFFFLTMSISACSDSFINHSLTFKKEGECEADTGPVKVLSNINGERYQFKYCLGENFNKDAYSVNRSGDSLLVIFPKPTGKQMIYTITLDIDAKPAYRFITLGEGGQTIEIAPKKF